MRANSRIFRQPGGTKLSVSAIALSGVMCALLGSTGGVIVAGMVQPETLGMVRAFGLPLIYLTCLHLGTFDGIQRLVPLLHGRGDSAQAMRLVSAAGAYNFLLSCVCSLGLLIVAVWNAAVGDYVSMSGWAAQAVAVWMVFYGGFLQSTFRTLSGFVALAKCQFGQALVSFLSIAIVPAGQFYGLCARVALTAFAGLASLQRAKPFVSELKFEYVSLVLLIRKGFPFAAWGSLYTSLWLAVEGTLVLAAGGIEALGFYSVAVLARDGVSILPQALQQVLSPQVIQAFGQSGKISQGIKRLLKITGLVSVIMCGVSVAVLVVLHWLIPTFLPEYSRALPLIEICVFFSVANAANLPFSSLVAVGDSWRFGRGIAIGWVCFLVGAWMLSYIVEPAHAILLGSLVGKLARTVDGYLVLFAVAKSENKS